MNRLQSELNRLYLSWPPAQVDGDAQAPGWIDASNRVRALVLELTRAPDWELLSRVWVGVQAELELPAPAIAVSGSDGLQLWFALAEPVAAARAHAFLDGLRRHFLPDVDARRVRLLPSADGSALPQPVPALQPLTGNWSAFVAQDLAPVFAEAPWLDIPPNEEGQANLLRGIALAKPAAFEAALARLGPLPEPVPTPAPPVAVPPGAGVADAGTVDPQRFLRAVMNDETVAMALRIEAAKALLQHARGQGG
ncbi:hypothetical protein [Pseudorhodoferax sp.]|uniref:hypothetical protein n=1 Tax=Pseudorhodoferax sp. TaxID=1993553 RepID=UPI002DD6B0B9|nr:hypothetical protein [Pseudorhodoferax sp.]